MRAALDPDSLDNRDPVLVRRVLEVVDPLLERFFAPTVRGLERIPSGAALYVANHNGGVLMPDAWAFASAVVRNRDWSDVPYALTHDLALRPPPLNRFLCSVGAVRARDHTAARIFARGMKVLAFPGGDLEVLRPFDRRDRIELGLHRGYIRLALRTGVPIIPVVSAGAHAGFMVLSDGSRIARAFGLPEWARVHVCPTVLSIPWGLTFGIPPPYVPLPTHLISEVLPAIRFERVGEDAAHDAEWVEACHARVVNEMQRALDRLSRERRAEPGHAIAARTRKLWTIVRDALASGSER